MLKVKIKDGTEFEADAVVKSRSYPVLHIYTHDITPEEAYRYFYKTDNGKEITVTQEYPADPETGETREPDLIVYHDFTEIYSVQKPQFYTQFENEILIWLDRPTVDYD